MKKMENFLRKVLSMVLCVSMLMSNMGGALAENSLTRSSEPTAELFNYVSSNDAAAVQVTNVGTTNAPNNQDAKKYTTWYWVDVILKSETASFELYMDLNTDIGPAEKVNVTGYYNSNSDDYWNHGTENVNNWIGTFTATKQNRNETIFLKAEAPRNYYGQQQTFKVGRYRFLLSLELTDGKMGEFIEGKKTLDATVRDLVLGGISSSEIAPINHSVSMKPTVTKTARVFNYNGETYVEWHLHVDAPIKLNNTVVTDTITNGTFLNYTKDYFGVDQHSLYAADHGEQINAHQTLTNGDTVMTATLSNKEDGYNYTYSTDLDLIYYSKVPAGVDPSTMKDSYSVKFNNLGAAFTGVVGTEVTKDVIVNFQRIMDGTTEAVNAGDGPLYMVMVDSETKQALGSVARLEVMDNQLTGQVTYANSSNAVPCLLTSETYTAGTTELYGANAVITYNQNKQGNTGAFDIQDFFGVQVDDGDTIVFTLTNELVTVPVTVNMKTTDQTTGTVTPATPVQNPPTIYLSVLDDAHNVYSKIFTVQSTGTPGTYTAELVTTAAALDEGSVRVLGLKANQQYDQNNPVYTPARYDVIGTGANESKTVRIDTSSSNDVSAEDFYRVTTTQNADGSVTVELMNDRMSALLGVAEAYQKGEITINEETGSFEGFDGGKYYTLNSPLGVAGSFHIVAFEQANLNVHTNGNVLAKDLYAKSNFGTNSKNGVIVDELSYIVNYKQVHSTSASEKQHVLALGAGNVLGLTDNGTTVTVNGVKMSAPDNIVIDKDASNPFIDLVAVESQVRSLSGTLRNYNDVGISYNPFDSDKTAVTLNTNSGAGYYRMSGAQLTAIATQGNGGKYAGHTFQMHFTEQNSGTIVMNIDCSGCTEVTMPHAIVYIDGEAQGTGEVVKWDNGKVIWNFYNAEGVHIHANNMTGMIVAPGATVSLESNVNGTVIADVINVNAESHRTDFVGTISPARANFSATKLVDNKTPTSAETFTFKLEQQEGENWVEVANGTATNSGRNVVFDYSPVYAQEGDYWYRVTEVQENIPGYTTDSAVYYIKVIVDKTVVLGNVLYTTAYEYYDANKQKLDGNQDLVFNNQRDVASLTLIKRDGKTDGLLEGATFTLQKLVYNHYFRDYVSDGSAPVTGTTDSLGRLNFFNLQDDMYHLLETEEPDGYVQTNSNGWRVEISNGAVTKLYYPQVQWYIGGSYISWHETTSHSNATLDTSNKTVTIINDSANTTISVSGTKVWEDGNDQDGKRPEKITLHLYKQWVSTAVDEESGELVETIEKEELADTVELTGAAVDKDGNWAFSFTDLEKYGTLDGVTYTLRYVVKEEVVTDYTATYTTNDDDSITIKNTHFPEKVSIIATKEWDDRENALNTRPESITYTLYRYITDANGDTVKETVGTRTVTPTEAGVWPLAAFTSLDKYANGEEIVYELVETEVEGYTSNITGGPIYTVTNTLDNDFTDVTVNKVWDHTFNNGDKPAHVYVTLYRNWEEDGEEKSEVVGEENVELNEGNGWTKTWNDLVKSENGITYTYSLVENEVTDYSADIDLVENEDGSYTFTVTNTYAPTVDIHGSKTWVDNADAAGERPASIEVKLMVGEEVIDTMTVTQAEGWHWSFDNLPKLDAEGEEIEYTIAETIIDGYVSNVSGYNITNTFATDIEVEKDWQDNDNQDGLRVAVTVELYRAVGDEMPVATGKAATLTEANGWKATFENLPVYERNANGVDQLITYSVVETTVISDYETDYVTKDYDQLVVVNKHTPETISLSGEKVWVGDEDEAVAELARPASVTINVLNGTAVAATTTATAENNWAWSVADLPKFEDGVEIDYTVEEVAHNGYTSDVDDTIITNTLKTIDLEGSKTWVGDAGYESMTRPAEITINAVANGKTIKTTTTNAAKGWAWKIEKLPEYDADGNKIIYTVVEEAVKGYNNGTTVTAVYNEETGKYVLTNTVDTTSVSVEKVWSGDHEHPTSLLVQLFANGTAKGSAVTLSATDGWQYTWNNLPKTAADGSEIEYTVDEVDENGAVIVPAGYVKKITGSAKTGYIIENIYVSDAFAVLEAKKELKGPKALEAGEFSFVLKSGETELQTKTNDANGNVTFEALMYDAAGTYTYTIGEVKGSEAGITYDETIYNVTVVVSQDEESKQLSTTVTYTKVVEGKEAETVVVPTFVNTYEVDDTSLPIPFSKTLTNGKQNEVARTFTFTLSGKGEQQTKTLEVAAGSTSANGSFDAIDFTAAGEYTYIVKETAGTATDILYDSTEYTVYVKVEDKDSQLTITELTVNDQPVDAAAITVAFENTYKAPTTIDLEANKTLTGKALEANAFEFQVTDGAGNVVKTAKNAADGTVKFEDIELTEEGSYTFTLSEVDGKAEGYIYDKTVYTVTVDVTWDATAKKLVAEATYEGGAAPTFVNYYVNAIEVELEAKKLLNNAAPGTETFQFVLKDSDGKQIGEKATNNAEGTVTFDPIPYTAAGTYTYTISEENEGKSGYTYDDTVYNVTVEVSENEETKQLSYMVTYTKVGENAALETVDEAVFTNTYEVDDTSLPIPFSKTLTNGEQNEVARTFTFTLSGKDEEQTKTLEVAAGSTSANGSFDAIEFTAAGEYTYIVKEITGTATDILYDSTEYTVYVKVEDKDSQLTITELTVNGQPVDAAAITVAFTNTYVAPGSATLQAKKELKGPKALEAGEFSFVLKSGETELQTKSNDANGNVTFEALTYDAAGTYTYTISEVKGSEAGITYDETIYNVTVVVSQDPATKQLSTAVTYTKAVEGEEAETVDVPTFVNTYEVDDTSLPIPFSKTLTNGEQNEVARTFTFTLSGEDEEQTKTLNVAAGSTSANGSFDAIEFTVAGEYTYTVKEAAETTNDIVYDGTEYEIVVTVEDIDSKLTVTKVKVNGNEVAVDEIEATVAFTNTYVAPGSAVLQAQKVLNGHPKALEAGEFSFELMQDSKVLQTKTNDKDGKVTFDPISYTLADMGNANTKQFVYTINEVSGDKAYYTYDTTVYTATVTVTRQGNALTIDSITYTKPGENAAPETVDTAIFTNTYKVEPTSVVIPFSKTLANGDQNELERTFIFTLLEGATELQTASLKVTELNYTDVSGSFAEIELKAAGTYTYTVKEQAGTDADITYDTAEYQVVVTVEDQNSKLAVTSVTYTKKGETTALEAGKVPAFTNTYNPATTELTVTKVWVGDEEHQTLRPTSIEVKLMYAVDNQAADQYEDKAVILNSANGWTAIFTDLPVKINKKVVTYSVEEVLTDEAKLNGYVQTGNEIVGTTATITNTLEFVDVLGTKVWDDDSNRDGKRPEKITVTLLAKGDKVDQVVVTADDKDVNDANTWNWQFTDLPKFDVDGKEIEYTVSETIEYAADTAEADKYAQAIDGGLDTATGDYIYEITNTYNPEKTKVQVTKAWDDDSDRDGVRPEKVTVKLTGTIAVDAATTKTVVEKTADVTGLLTENNWTYTFEELPKMAEGKVITYTVEETEVPAGYQMIQLEGDANTGFTITNQHEITKISIDGTKVWADDSNRDNARPASVVIVLTSDDPEFVAQEVTVEAATGDTDTWSYTFTDLPKYLKTKDADGKPVEVTYTVAEKDVPAGYKPVVDGYKITNDREFKTVEITGSKTWVDLNDKYLKRPDSVTIRLLADDVEIDSKVVTEDDNWSWTFTNLPKYKTGAVGQEIKYTIEEDVVTGYITTVEDYNVINSLNLVEFIKTDEQTGKRLPGATFALYEGKLGEYDESKPVETWVSTKDAKVLAGLKVGQTYTIVETAAPSGYAMMTPFQFTVELTDIPGTYRAFSASNCHVYRFRKLDSATNGLVHGAQMAVTDANGTVIETWWSNGDNDGWHEIADSRLVSGVTYKLVELNSPWGYELAEPITFSISPVDGMLIINGSKSLSADLVMYDEPWPEVTPTPEPTETSFTVTKRWEDKDNVLGLRPTSITVHLYRKLRTDADYSSIPFMTVNIPNNGKDVWTFTFENLPRRSAEGVLYDYSIREELVEGYVVTYLNNGKTIVNTIPEEDYPPTPTPTLPYVTPTPSPMPRIPTGVQFIDGEWVYVDEYGIPLGGIPLTGDDTNFVLWGMAIGLPLLVAALAAVEIRRRKKLLVAAEQEEEVEDTEA